jgi:hypothetical protein
MPKQKSAKKPAKSFEESLWETATKLRGSVESSEYKHVVLSLIFLKFVSDKFEERRAELVAEGKEKYVDMVEFYTMKNVFYLPETSRWSYIQQHAKQGDIAIKIDSALTAVEKSNASLKGALPDNYFSRLGLDGSKLSALIDAINNIDTIGDKEEDTVGRVYEYFLGKFAASEGKLGGRVLHAQVRRQSHRRDDRALQGQDLRSLLRLRRHVRAVAQVRGKPPRQYQGHFGLRAGADRHHLQAGKDEPRRARALGKPRRRTRRYLFQGPAPGSEGGLHHGEPALQSQGLARPR